jgi:hypothetical protein
MVSIAAGSEELRDADQTRAEIVCGQVGVGPTSPISLIFLTFVKIVTQMRFFGDPGATDLDQEDRPL